MSLPAGSRVGAYEIVSLLGAGGMGEVYRAHDPRLGRDVAVKVITATLAADPDRVRRFEQEARAAAALTHPNILAVHDVGSHESSPYIVSELLAGQTLRERMSGSALPVRKATEIVIQIARGLAAAHAKGIVHRDLKPENVFITDDGHVKILDFGLAKLTEADPQSGRSITTRKADTEPGSVMGTAGYMSPEQLRGQAVDHRSDIFAFGAVLYELLAGARAFRGETSMDIAMAILKDDPPDLPAAERHIPPALTRIVDRCLEKNPASRFQSAGDLAFALDALSGSQTGVTETMTVAVGAPARRPSWILVAAVAVVLGGLVMYGITRLLQPAADEEVATSFPLTLPAGVTLVTAGGAASPGPLAVSPDGRLFALLAIGADGTRSLWVRSRNAVTPRQIPGTSGALSPFWSPDSKHLAFFADGKLKRVEVAGGPPTELCEARSPIGGSWGRQGDILFGVNTAGIGIQRIPESGGTPVAVTKVAEGENSHSRPYFLPDGRRFLFRALAGGLPRGWVYVGALDGSSPVQLVETESSNTVFSAGHVLFLQGSTLMARSFDAARLSFSGDAFPIAEPIQTIGNVPVGMFSASENGVLVYQTGGVASGSELVWFDRNGTRQRRLGERGLISDVRLSPDDSRVAFSLRSERAAETTSDIWIVDVASGQSSHFTFDAGNEFASVWSADGRQIIFNSSRRGPMDLFMKPADGAGAETELLANDESKFPVDWTADGRHLLYWVQGRGNADAPGDRGAGRAARGRGPNALGGGQPARLWALPLVGDRKPFPAGPGVGPEGPGNFSPDPAGRWLTYTASENGTPEVYVVPFPPTGAKWQISKDGGNISRWSHDGKEIFFLHGAPLQMMAARVDATGSAIKVIEIKALFPVTPAGQRANYAVSRDGQRFLVNTRIASDPSGSLPPPTVVINWLAWKGK